ncbi:copper resistance protein CopC [Robbsia sp. Bb-Pol-6]|uniref:Copper resistance protein CopC n=1 Tax=Robbsia betulipollinis TaxID=2981849 RepID=A0ABT3ZLI1_9BURK|nr:copper resistance CopC family protein [Robbsia betulipollinis]MCY0386810.1 copper resistance protein CopC [Robbsia betulipollinis]
MNRISPARALAAALIMTGARLATAHAHPAQEAPGAGQTLATAPREVAIDFDESVDAAFTSIAVADARGRSVTRGKAAADTANGKHVSVPLQPLPSGRYTVSWVAVARDGHRTQGHYSFAVK